MTELATSEKPAPLPVELREDKKVKSKKKITATEKLKSILNLS